VSNKHKKITVLLDQAEFSKFDQFCYENGFKKSTLLVRLLREFLEREALAKNEPLPHFDRSKGIIIGSR
jgi:hypothetical protein